MTTEPDFVNFCGTKWDIEQAPNPIRPLLARDHARLSHPPPTRYRAVVSSIKFCLACPHWARFHPGHGECIAHNYYGWGSLKCACTAFADPEPGRPDQVYTRDQIDRMSRCRWEARKHRIFLLRDGRYGLWDQWSSPDWLAKPGDVFKPWLDDPQPGPSSTSPQEPPGPSQVTEVPSEP
jgi:hypothetical protein